jgi:hypothetical protein
MNILQMNIKRFTLLLQGIYTPTPSPRYAMYVWASDYYTKTQCDTLLAWCTTHHITDLYLFVQDTSSPKTWMGQATLGRVTAYTCDGVTPVEYLISEAAPLNIKIHAWLWMCSFSYWGGSPGLMTPDAPNNSTYADGTVWNFANSTARTKLVNTIVDFVESNPGLAGINLDYESTTVNIVESDMTLFMTELRPLVPGIEITVCTGARISDDTYFKLDIDTWLLYDLMDTVFMMCYYNNLAVTKQYVDSLTLTGKSLFAGAAVEPSLIQPSDFGARLLALRIDDYYNFGLFNWYYMNANADLVTAYDAWYAGTLSDTQGIITEVEVVPGTSFTVVVDGVSQTIYHADVTDHTTTGALKKHVEAALGSTNPDILYERLTAASVRLVVGGFEP